MNLNNLFTETFFINGISKSMPNWNIAAFLNTFLSFYFSTQSKYSNMKRIIWIAFFIVLSIPDLYSQNIDKPTVASQSNMSAIIWYVEIKNDETIVAISIDYSQNKSFRISRLTSLKTNTGNALPLVKFTTGNGWLNFDKKFSLSKNKHIVYLYFDKISPTTSTIDIIDSSNGGNYWKGVSLKKANSSQTSKYSSTSSNNKSSISDVYNSAQQIRNYFASNIQKLDPIEGEYDVEFSGEYVTPFVHQYLDRENFIIWIVRNSNTFTIYTDIGGFRKSRLLKLQSVGETNVYTFFYDSTPTRVYLQNLNHFTASLHLNNSSAATYRGTATAASVNIFPIYDCIKVYPTMSMYADIIRNNYEEISKPTSWTGTGFAMANNFVVTNYHVVEEAKNISIQGINGNFNAKFSATVVAADKINDLAILKVNGVSITGSIPYSVKTTTSDVGEDVFVLGYPLTSTMGDEIKLTTGVVSSRTGFQGDVSLYQISAPIQPGNSGGPLFDSKGNVIGIVSAKHRGAENVGYAIKASYLRNLMESAISTNILPLNNKISGLNLSGKVKSVKNYVYYITCTR